MVSSRVVFVVSGTGSCLYPKIRNHIYDDNDYMTDF